MVCVLGSWQLPTAIDNHLPYNKKKHAKRHIIALLRMLAEMFPSHECQNGNSRRQG